MNYLRINIRSFMKREPAMFFLILLCSFTAAVILYFSLGMIVHYQENRRRGDINAYDMRIYYTALENAQRANDPDYEQKAENYLETEKNMDYMTVGELRNFLRDVPKELFINCSQLIVNAYYDADNAYVEFMDDSGAMASREIYQVRFSFHYDEASQIISPIPQTTQKLIYGDYLSIEDETYGTHNAVIGIGVYNDLFVEGRKKDPDLGYDVNYDSSYNFEDHTEFTLFGETYHIVGVTEGTDIDVPFNSLNNELPICTFWSTFMTFIYDIPVTNQQEELLRQYIDNVYSGSLSVEELEHTYINTSFYTMLIAVLILVIIIAVTNIAVIFRYILMKRRKQIAIFKLCGCCNCTAMFVEEGMVLTIPAFLVGTLVYMLLLRPLFVNMFVFMGAAYSLLSLIAVFLMFAILAFTALYISVYPVVNQTPVTIWKGET